jgi:predicted small lipoprotein YifL
MFIMIKKFIGKFSIALIAGTMLVTLSACEQKGPAEKAGEKLDNTVEKAGEQIEKAGDSIREATKPDNN